MRNFFVVLNTILFAIVLAMAVNWLYFFIMKKRYAKMLTEEEFREGMRKAQVIDVRERNEFNAGHIVGARNLPYSSLANGSMGLRKDQPIYLYDTSTSLSVRTAKKLRKKGYSDIYVLKDGFRSWTGKIKTK